ncbi:phosphatase PAP2 family protein [Dokdonella soli]|uniref:Acid phosphatase n=1 Tax=Dokdonella soli TaxID=529810 RepID=A0ABN1ISM0_9GAMM
MFRTHPRLNTALALALLLAGSVHARDAQHTDHPHYLDDTQLHAAVALLPPPSPPGSAEDVADQSVTFQVYTTRSAEQAALAKKEESFDAFAFAAVLGPDFNPQRLPRTAALFAAVKKDVAAAKNEAKQTWRRERPCPVNSCQWDPEGDASDWKNRDYSYPSGHATRATVFAILLGKLFPQRADALDRYARDVDWRRVVRGVHTPQDIYAGRVLGQALARDFLASASLQRDLKLAATEIAAAGIAGSDAGKVH